jgi:hypothetical protein
MNVVRRGPFGVGEYSAEYLYDYEVERLGDG